MFFQSLLRQSSWLCLSYDRVPGCVSLTTECLAASLLRQSALLCLSYDRVPGCVSLTTECPAVSYDRVPGCVFLRRECLAVSLLRQGAWWWRGANISHECARHGFSPFSGASVHPGDGRDEVTRHARARATVLSPCSSG